MKDFIEYLVKKIATKPKKVKVEETEDNGMLIYKVTADEEDMGIVIGKEGKNIRALRNLAKAKAIKDNIHIKIFVEDTYQNND